MPLIVYGWVPEEPEVPGLLLLSELLEPLLELPGDSEPPVAEPADIP
jgi:hypothetical protein